MYCIVVVTILSARFTLMYLRVASGYWVVRPQSCLIHSVQSRSIGRSIDMGICVRIRVDGISCQAFQYVRLLYFVSTMRCRHRVW